MLGQLFSAKPIETTSKYSLARLQKAVICTPPATNEIPNSNNIYLFFQIDILYIVIFDYKRVFLITHICNCQQYKKVHSAFELGIQWPHIHFRLYLYKNRRSPYGYKHKINSI